jgi:hypothetical protein
MSSSTMHTVRPIENKSLHTRYIAGMTILFCLRANIQQKNSTVGRNKIFSVCLPQNTSIYGDFTQNKPLN